MQALDTSIKAYGESPSRAAWLNVRASWVAFRDDAKIPSPSPHPALAGLQDEFKEKLATNLKPARPFLMRKLVDGSSLVPLPASAAANASSSSSSSAHSYSDSDSDSDDEDCWFYHSTSHTNLVSIQTTGLLPQFGGRGGSGTIVGGATGDAYNKASEKVVHGTPDKPTAKKYALLRESPADFIKIYGDVGKLRDRPEPSEIGELAIVLRFRKSHGLKWEQDPSETMGGKTTSAIPRTAIEALTTEGWVKLEALSGLAEALQGEPDGSASSSSSSSSVR
ncbi:hypothetical protein [Roseateles sp.]|uniref:hypothetical protein n=1 Tax=Roseateles sp. TaxID=1971397 RepID=UPI00326374CC